MMEFRTGHQGQDDTLVTLFTRTFAASEGVDEGHVIGALVENLLASTPPDELRVFSALDGATAIGCILFTRLLYPQADRTVFLLAPVAIATDRQGQGVGQKLIAVGLDAIRAEGIDVAVTYGDLNFYGRVGFKPVPVETVPAPFALSMPEGWLGQSLTGQPLDAIPGPAVCVAGFNDPKYW